MSKQAPGCHVGTKYDNSGNTDNIGLDTTDNTGSAYVPGGLHLLHHKGEVLGPTVSVTLGEFPNILEL